MVDEPSGSILQVELNTIASSFGCLSTKVDALKTLDNEPGREIDKTCNGAMAVHQMRLQAVTNS